MNENYLETDNKLQQTQAGDSLDKENVDVSNKNSSATNDDLQIESSKTELSEHESSSDKEEFNSDEWLDLLDNKDILKKTIFTKETNPDNPTLPRVNQGSKTLINLETRVYSTQQLIESESFQNLEVIVGDYDVIHGIDLILPMMYLYEKARVVINPRFGYGSKGNLPNVQPNCRLDCIVEILSIDNDFDELNFDQKIDLAEKKKNRGNFWYAREEYQTAISCYRKCAEIFENIDDTELNKKANGLLVDCYNNLSIAQLKVDQLNAALESVDKSLTYDPKNVKALYRKAQILDKKNELEEAVELLKIAIELDPNNSPIANLLIKLRKRRLIELENERKLYQKMISNDNQTTQSINNEHNAFGSFEKHDTIEPIASKKFKLALVGISVIVAIVLAVLVNRYLENYSKI